MRVWNSFLDFVKINVKYDLEFGLGCLLCILNSDLFDGY